MARRAGWHWGGNLVKHLASITYRKLTSPLVVTTSFNDHALT